MKADKRFLWLTKFIMSKLNSDFPNDLDNRQELDDENCFIDFYLSTTKVIYFHCVS